MSTVSEKLDGVRTQPLQTNNLLSQKDLGVRILDQQVGGCQRRAWYKVHGVNVSNPRKDRLVKADHVDAKVKELFLDAISACTKVKERDFSWEVGAQGTRFKVDALIEDTDGTFYGVVIHTGGGIAFRNEVFGTQYSKGAAKDQDWIQASMLILTSPIKMERIELLYVDRGMMDDVTYVMSRPGMTSTESIVQFLNTASDRPLPACSYQKDWTNAERVAALYANKAITKKAYEEYKNNGVGGDWQCKYCEFLNKCYEDDRSFR